MERPCYEQGEHAGCRLLVAGGNEYIGFAPELSRADRADLERLGRCLVRRRGPTNRLAFLEKELSETDGRRVRYRAVVAVLRDLARHEFQFRVRRGVLEVRPITFDGWDGPPEEYKAFQRRLLLEERDAQLRLPTVRRFVESMEETRLHDGRSVSVRNLIADGRTVRNALEKQGINGIRPYLQVIEAGNMDRHTGLKLQDVWRYFRHTWSIPYNWTPGRTMNILVRDAAQPFHPVIGILGLGSSVVQISVRDREIGWSVEAMEARARELLETPADEKRVKAIRQYLACLRQGIRDAKAMVYTKDLLGRSGTVSQRQLERLERLAASGFEATLPKALRRGNARDWRAEALSSLFKHKRAKALARIWKAHLFLESIKYQPAAVQLEKLVSTPGGTAALSTCATEIKKARVGQCIMDLVVCGAIAPYSYLVGGKLVAMLATSPEVTRAYWWKYRQSVSEIASAMRGAPVVRPPHLAFLGTTSLYETHSSQYDRVRLPADYGQIQFTELGKTEGFSSIHFSPQTVVFLENVTLRRRGQRANTNRFGEGVNPKLRRITAGLIDLGLDSKLLTIHSRRIVYGVCLASNARAFLQGRERRLKYYWEMSEPRQTTERIGRFWLERWALPRLGRADFADRITAFSQEDLMSLLRPPDTRVEVDWRSTATQPSVAVERRSATSV